MIRINLLAADRPTKKKKSVGRRRAATPGAVQAYLLLTVFAGGAVLVCLALYLYMSGQIRELDSKIVAAEQRQRELQAIKKQVDELEQKRATFQRKVDLIYKLQAEQQGPVHLLDELSKALPDFVWLSNLDQTGEHRSGSTARATASRRWPTSSPPCRRRAPTSTAAARRTRSIGRCAGSPT